MKQLFLFAAFAVASGAAIAQPTITSATNNPVPGDVIYEHLSDTTGISKGPSGANVVWDLSNMTDEEDDTTYYLGCPVSTWCDSFTTVNVIGANDGDTTFYHSTLSGFYSLGDYSAMTGFDRYTDSQQTFPLPLSYLATIADTTSYSPSPGVTVTDINTYTGDAWGSLKLPDGVYRNVLRLHIVNTEVSMFGSVPLFSNMGEAYAWLVPGFHAPLAIVGYDTAGTGTPYVSFAAYLTGTGYSPVKSALGFQPAATAAAFTIAPNPAQGQVTFGFSLGSAAGAALTIADVTGRTVGTIPTTDLKQGANSITFPVSQLTPGIYIARLQSADGVQSHRFVVSH